MCKRAYVDLVGPVGLGHNHCHDCDDACNQWRYVGLFHWYGDRSPYQRLHERVLSKVCPSGKREMRWRREVSGGLVPFRGIPVDGELCGSTIPLIISTG